MKLYLNDKQRSVLMEMLSASQANAAGGKDVELALNFEYLYNKIKPLNATYVNLNRSEAETIVEFCDIVRKSLETALDYINTKSEKPEEEKDSLREETNRYLTDVTDIINQLHEKIRSNPTPAVQ